MSDFFSSHTGTAKPIDSRRWRQLRLMDKMYDLRVALGRGMHAVRREAAERGPTRVLVVGIEVPSRAGDIHSVVAKLRAESKHDVTVSIAPMGDKGKFANIDDAIAGADTPLSAHDWLVIVDDDIAFDRGLLDDMIAVAGRADFALAQPAHGFASHATYSITRRRFGSLARRTDFVEIGPLTLVRSDLFADLVPFPPSRWCYGIDLVWSEVARRRGRKMGVIDATPMRHLRPVAASYDMDAAWEEGRALLIEHGVTVNRAELFARDEVISRA